MKKTIAIYLAGTIQKGHENSDSRWTDDDMAIIRETLSEYEISFLNPAFRSDNLSDQHSVFGRDMLQVFSCDVVFVDARDRRGLGVGAEMMWAKFNEIPVVTLSPKDSHYNKSETTLLSVAVENWTHPFVEALSDKIVEDIYEGAQWIEEVMCNELIEIKGIDHIVNAMNYYKETQLQNDKPMQRLITSNEEIRERIDMIAELDYEEEAETV